MTGDAVWQVPHRSRDAADTWLGVFFAGENCTRLPDGYVEPPYNPRWAEKAMKWPKWPRKRG